MQNWRRLRPQCLQHPFGHFSQRAVVQNVVPFSRPPDDIAAMAPCIDMGMQLAGATSEICVWPKQKVKTAGARAVRSRRREAFAIICQPLLRLDVLQIEINYHELNPSWYTDQCIRPTSPP